MRRGTVLSILTVLFALTGVACVVHEARLVRSTLHAHYPLFAGLLFLVLATAGGFLTIAVFRRDCRRLTAVVRQLAQGSRGALTVEPASTAEREMVPLVQSINDLVEFAEHSVTDAALRLKELEIQLKVATAQREHAEAILYSISDGVIVTDTFDEVVLANEAAATTFGFDVAAVQAGRKPIDQVLSDQTMIGLIREMRQSRSTTARRVIEHTVGAATAAAATATSTTSGSNSGGDDAGGGAPSSPSLPVLPALQTPPRTF